jgi:hydroxyethylthiazole kinase
MKTIPLVPDAIARLRARAPLIHNITNYVVMNTTANALLAIGASPAMVHAEEEVAEFAAISQALVVNIGTISAPWFVAMEMAVASANRAGVPWVFDPVAAGATTFRKQASAELAGLKPAVIRGNASEILALASGAASGKGVDSTAGVERAEGAARSLARNFGTVVAVSGAVDFITDGLREARVANGDVTLTRVTGMGCTASALTGAYLGAGLDAAEAGVAALVTLGVAGEIAAAASEGPGSFSVAVMDALHALDDAALAARARVT